MSRKLNSNELIDRVDCVNQKELKVLINSNVHGKQLLILDSINPLVFDFASPPAS